MRTTRTRTVTLRRIVALGAIAVMSIGLAACGDDEGSSGDTSATELSGGITPEEDFCNDLRILIDAAKDGETLDPATATRDEVESINTEFAGALTELGISAQGAEIQSPALDEIFAAQVPAPAPSDELTTETVEEFQASLAKVDAEGEEVKREFC